MIPNECSALYEKHFPFWDRLKPEERLLLCQNTRLAEFDGGVNIHGNNGDCTDILVVKSGCLRCYLLSEEGKEITLYRMYAGDICILSASCILSSITFDVFIDTEEKSGLYLIDTAVFSDLAGKNLYLENFALRVAATRFSDAIWAMQQILFMNMDQRLAVFLNDELSKTGGDTIRLTHEQVAKYMGSAREVVSRTLKNFVSGHIVELTRGGIRVIDKSKLKSLITG